MEMVSKNTLKLYLFAFKVKLTNVYVVQPMTDGTYHRCEKSLKMCMHNYLVWQDIYFFRAFFLILSVYARRKGSGVTACGCDKYQNLVYWHMRGFEQIVKYILPINQACLFCLMESSIQSDIIKFSWYLYILSHR